MHTLCAHSVVMNDTLSPTGWRWFFSLFAPNWSRISNPLLVHKGVSETTLSDSYLTNGCTYLLYREMLFVYEFGFSWHRSQFGNNESKRHYSYKYLWLNIGCSGNLCKNVSTGISLVWILRHVEGLLISMPSVWLSWSDWQRSCGFM